MRGLEIVVDLSSPPEQVWHALTDRDLLAQWFMPTDLRPIAGELYRAFPPPGMAGFGTPFDIEVLEIRAPYRLALRWRGAQLHADVVWEVTPFAGGSRLRVSQTGFLGVEGATRRVALLESYALLFQERLPALLAGLAPAAAGRLAVAPAPPEPAFPPVVRHGPTRPRWWRKLRRMPVDHRLRLLSVTGAMILTVLTATAFAAGMLHQPGGAPADALSLGRGPGQGTQPGPSSPIRPPIGPSKLPSPSSPIPEATTGPGGHTAAYATAENYALGYIGSITVRPGPAGLAGWSATIELPPGVRVTSAWDQMAYRQTGATVVFTPGEAHRELAAGTAFTFSFQVTDHTGFGRPVACAVDGVTCTGLIDPPVTADSP